MAADADQHDLLCPGVLMHVEAKRATSVSLSPSNVLRQCLSLPQSSSIQPDWQSVKPRYPLVFTSSPGTISTYTIHPTLCAGAEDLVCGP